MEYESRRRSATQRRSVSGRRSRRTVASTAHAATHAATHSATHSANTATTRDESKTRSGGMRGPSDDQLILKDRFLVGRKIGNGSFATVYFGRDTKTRARIAIKTEDIKKGSIPQLQSDVATLRRIRELGGGYMPTGFTRLLASGVEKSRNIRYAVVELLGRSIEELVHAQPSRRFTVHTVLMLADQAISRLQVMHDAGFIHRDIKLANLMMGTGPFAPVLYLIDFGLTKSYLDGSGKHILEKDPLTGKLVKTILAGTLSYMSLRAHEHLQQSRRDDLESLAYVCVRLLTRHLPWKMAADMQRKKKPDMTTQEENALVLDVKKKTPLTELCKSMPPVFHRWIIYARNLAFDERPDYKMLRRWLHDVMALTPHETFDAVYDWSEK